MEETSMQAQPNSRQIFFWRVVIGVMGTLGVGVIVFIIWMIVTYFQANAWARVPACGELRSTAATQQLLQQSAGQIDGINERGGSDVAVSPRSDCPGKAVIQMYYGTHSQGSAIREFLGDTFNGVPYQMMNI
ncbi:MAG: hypothetical protein HZC01_03950 [Candidatus Kerfeldbacteria bacterium]|nr:hypothetical protein [Candidatus Kerfeldbacteria bacterium]